MWSVYLRECNCGARTPADATAKRTLVYATATHATAKRMPVDVPLLGLLSTSFLLLVSFFIDPMDLPLGILYSSGGWTSPLLILCSSTTVVISVLIPCISSAGLLYFFTSSIDLVYLICRVARSCTDVLNHDVTSGHCITYVPETQKRYEVDDTDVRSRTSLSSTYVLFLQRADV